MGSIRAIGWLGAFAATACVWAGFPARPSPSERTLEGVALLRGIGYGPDGDGPRRLDLLVPAGGPRAAPLPILLAVHGGSWTGGSKRDYRAQFAPIARAGVAVAVVDYQLARPGAPSWDGALEDVLAAADRLIREAPSLGLDPTRVATLGTSSGGLLAALSAQRDPRIRAAVCLGSPFSLLDLAGERGQVYEPARMFLGADPADDPSLAREASPLDGVAAGGPAMLLIHGDDDDWVPIDQARKMQRSMIALGARCELLELPGARHGFELQVGAPEPRDLTPAVLDFLRSVWAERAGPP